MTDRPILYSAPMIRALLDMRKTQTRRLMKTRKDLTLQDFLDHGERVVGEDGINRIKALPGMLEPSQIEVGDRLWVREAWRTFVSLDAVPPRDLLQPGRGAGILYEADDGGLAITAAGERSMGERDDRRAFGKLRPGMFMPRWASRLTQVVETVRVERLNDIQEEDAWAEGVCTWAESQDRVPWCNLSTDDRRAMVRSIYGGPVNAYRHLWEHISGEGSWARNPWVSVTSFTTNRCNIDEMLGGEGA